MRLTIKTVAALKPAAAEYIEWDDTMPGLGLRVHPTGRKVWLLRYRTAANVQRKLTLGKAEAMTPDQARDEARSNLERIRKGEDPTRERRQRRHSMAMRELHESYLAARTGKAKPYSLGLYRGYWDNHLDKPLGGIPVVEISALDIQEVHSGLAATPYMANRCLQYLKAMLNYAERMKLRPRGSNPSFDVQRYPEKARQRVLTPAEVRQALTALTAYRPRAWSAAWLLRLLLLTGLRKNELAGCRWEWVNLIDGVVELPDTKTGARTVTLSEPAIEIMRELRRLSTGVWVFPNEAGTDRLRQVNRHLDRVCASIGLGKVRVHDLRHTLGSLSHHGGLSQREVADLLGHRNMRTTARYIGAVSDSREAANRAAAALTGGLH